MKITKRQLKRIIKEERAKLLKEGPPAGSIPGNEISEQLGKLHDAIGILWELMGPDKLAEELFGIAEDVRSEAAAGRQQRGE